MIKLRILRGAAYSGLSGWVLIRDAYNSIEKRRGNVTLEADWSDAATSPGKLQLPEAGRSKESPP